MYVMMINKAMSSNRNGDLTPHKEKQTVTKIYHDDSVCKNVYRDYKSENTWNCYKLLRLRPILQVILAALRNLVEHKRIQSGKQPEQLWPV